MGSKKPTMLIVISGFIVYRVLLMVSLYCQRGVVIFTSFPAKKNELSCPQSNTQLMLEQPSSLAPFLSRGVGERLVQ